MAVNKKIITFLSNMLSSMTVNITKILITLVLTLVLPKFLGEADYSYWQLYLFYFTYLAYSSLGWCEGTYLKYGGDVYEKLPVKKIAGQFWTLAVYELIFNAIFSLLVVLFVQDEIKTQILIFAALSAILDILRYYLQMVLQATNKIKEYAQIATCERILFLAFSLLCLFLHKWEFVYFIYAELVARLLSLLYAVVACKGIVFVWPEKVGEIWQESKELIGSGYKLLVAGIASQLIIGIVRFAVENKWGNLVFGKVSLALSMVHMIITFISAVGIVVFPMIKRLPEDKLMKVYSVMREVITTSLLCVLICYVPMKMLLQLWLPQYAESFRYLAILLPICVYETRYVVLLGTYFKALRKEQLQLKANLISMFMSIAITIVVVYCMNNLNLAILSIVLLMAFKAYYSEYVLKNYVEVKALKDNLWECILVVGFMVLSWFLQGWSSLAVYALLLTAYVVFRRKKIRQCVGDLKRMLGR